MFDNNTKHIVINMDQMIDLLAEVNEKCETVEAGGCAGYRLNHPKHGHMLLVQTPSANECMAFKF